MTHRMARFVLVPGAWLGAWAWRQVTPFLEKNGHSVYPITLTGMADRVHLASRDVGMETAIQDVLNAVNYEELDDFVLVGHSFAGKVAAAVADRAHPVDFGEVRHDAARPRADVRRVDVHAAARVVDHVAAGAVAAERDPS